MNDVAATHETLETRVSRIIGDQVVRSRTLSGGMIGELSNATRTPARYRRQNGSG